MSLPVGRHNHSGMSEGAMVRQSFAFLDEARSASLLRVGARAIVAIDG